MTVELRDAYRNITILDNTETPLGVTTAQQVDANFQIKAGFGIALNVDPATNKVTIINTGPGAGALTTIVDTNINQTFYPIFTRAPGAGDVNPLTGTYQMDTMYLDQTTTPMTYNPSTATLTVEKIYAPIITGHPTIEGVVSTGATGSGKIVFDTNATLDNVSFINALTIHGVTSTGATGTGKFVFDTGPSISNPTITGHPVVEGVTSTGATGTGKFVFDTSPTLVTPALGSATATSINKMSITAPTTGSTLAVADGKTFTVNNTITLNGTDSTTITLPTSTGTVALDNQQFYLGTTQIAINRTSGSQVLNGVSIDGNAATVTNGIYSNQVYTNPSWIGSLSIGQGGTGSDNANGALANLLPSGASPGYVLKTSGVGSYFWAAETAGSTIVGTSINSSRASYIAEEGQTVFTGVGTYTIGASQLRVYIEGVRQFPSEYTESSSTSFTLNTPLPAGTKVLAEVDTFVNNTIQAIAVVFNATGGISTNNVQAALEELDTEKAPKDSPTFSTSLDGTTTFTAFGSSSTLTLGFTGTGASSTTNISSAALTGVYSKVINIGTNGAAGSTTAINIGSSVNSSTNVSGNLTVTGDLSSSGSIVSDSKGEIRLVPANTQTASYQLLISDHGKYISTNSGVIVPAGVFSAGQNITIYNDSTANITITQAPTVALYLVGTSTTGNRTLAQRGLCTVFCVGSNTFVISGGGLS